MDTAPNGIGAHAGRGAAFALVALLFSAVLHAQSPLPPDMDLFGDGIVKPIQVHENGMRMQMVRIAQPAQPATSGLAEMPKKKLKGYDHSLVFHDGRTLRGQIETLTKDGIIWRRPDATAPLRFPRDEVRRIVLGEGQPQDGEPIHFGMEPATQETPATKASQATVKLPGGDWLFGDIAGADGENFTLKLDDGAEFKFARGAIEWLHFGMLPAPAFGFSGDAMAMEGWMLGNPSAGIEAKDGALLLKGGGWIGRTMSPPSRFEVSFELPQDAARQTTRLWLQPYGPQPNSYSTGTVELQFGKTELSHLIYFNRFERKTVPMPKDDAKGPIAWRVFYDGAGDKLTVFRNGKEFVALPMRGKEDENAGNNGRREIQPPRSMCFDSNWSNEVLSLRALRVQPWDGVLPKDGAARAEDTMTVGKDAPKSGKFSGVTDKEIVFAGEKKPRAAGTFIQLANKPATLAGGDALLVFGTSGEIAAADLEIRDGRAKARTSIAPLDVPASSLRTIALPRKKADAPPLTDVLVFRNGDTLRGKLISAGDGAPVRWKLGEGQEVDFQSARIAGVRLARDKSVKAATGSALELRNGDRLRGELAGLDAERVRFKHALLGEASVARAKVWALYPNKDVTLYDAGARPELWTGEEQLEGAAKGLIRRVVVMSGDGEAPAPGGRVYLDGAFIGAPQKNSNNYSQQLALNMPSPPDRYELRLTATDSGGSDPYANISLGTADGNGSVQFSLSYGEMRVYAYHSQRNRMVNNNREVSLASKLTEHFSRRALRIFVDTKRGTADVLVDGVLIMKFGQQASERIPGIGANIQLGSYTGNGSAIVLSDVRLGPWNGELPRPGENAGAILLANGDVASGGSVGVKDGALLIESDAGPLEVPFDRVQAIEFGGKPEPEKSAARVRLADGALVHLDKFRFENGAFTAHSPVLGAVKVPAASVAEIALNPTPARFPKVAEPKKLVKKEEAEAQPQK